MRITDRLPLNQTCATDLIWCRTLLYCTVRITQWSVVRRSRRQTARSCHDIWTAPPSSATNQLRRSTSRAATVNGPAMSATAPDQVRPHYRYVTLDVKTSCDHNHYSNAHALFGISLNTLAQSLSYYRICYADFY